MKRINLLALGMAACFSLSAQAQLVDEKFEAEQTKTPTEQGYYKFINVPPIGAEGCNDSWAVNDGVLNIDNDAAFPCDGQKWQRALKFFHLPIQAGKFYRVSFDITAGDESNGYVDVKLMQGDENADICILGANGEEQRDNFQMVAGQTKHYSTVFFYADEAKQMEAYKVKEGAENYAPNEYFVNINVYNPGKYTLDNVYVEEVAFKSAGFASAEFSNICIDYGKASNIKDLVAASENPGSLALPSECAVVTDLDGNPLELDAIELRADGKLYIFGNVAFETETIKVKFTNPTDEAHKIVLADGSEASFEAEIGSVIDADLASMASWAWTPAQVVSMTPSNDSFNYDPDLKEVTVTFDHDNMVASGEGAVQATLDGTPLTIKEGTPEEARTITFVYNGENLANGKHTIIISNIASNGGEVVNEDDVKATFEVGKHKIAKTIYTKIEGGEIFVPAGYDNQVPDGWVVVTNNETRLPGTGYGSGGRTFTKPYGPTIYFRAGNGEEGSVTTPAVTLPAGLTQLRAYVAAWKNEGHDCLVQILDAENNVVKEAKITGTANAENGNAAFEYAELKIDFEAVAGEYHLKFNDATLNGNGLAIKGGQFYSVEKTEGESVETETVAASPSLTSGIIPAHGTGWKIYRNDNRMRDPGANGEWTGCTDWTGGGGPRPQSSGMTGPIGGTVFYLNGGAYVTYGQFDVQTDHNGPVVAEGETEALPEKTLDLEAAKYQVTYYIGGWKNPAETHNVTFDIFKFEDGITGTPVYTRTDNDAPDANGTHNKAAGGSTGKKINFFWSAPEAGKYILKFTAGGEGEGEAVLGGVTIESTVSLPIQYAQMLDNALEPLVEEQGVAHTNDNYAGDTRDAIDAAVIEYSAPDYHTVAEFENSINNCGILIKQMQKRRSNIDAYPQALTDVNNGLNAAKGTKYEALEQFPIVENAYNTYKDVDYISLDDEELASAVAVMQANGALLKYMAETGAQILTKQINDLVAAIIGLDEEAAGNEFVVAAYNAVSDDQALVNNLKTLYAAKLYKKFAEVEDPFHKIVINPEDPENTEVIDIEYPADFLIQNPIFYSKDAPVIDGAIPDARNNFPGWTINVESGKVEPVWATTWGEQLPTLNNPVVDCAVKSPYGAVKFSVEQVISNIPVGKYNVSIAVGTDAKDMGGNLYKEIYGYCGENKVYLEDENAGRASKLTCLFEDVLAPEGDNMLASLTLGAFLDASNFSQVDDAKLQLVAKDPNFDYAAAAEALGEKTAIIEAIAGNQPAEAPISTQIISVDGKVGASSSIVIKIEKWANGFMKVTKLAK